jgi:hypothetical protein
MAVFTFALTHNRAVTMDRQTIVNAVLVQTRLSLVLKWENARAEREVLNSFRWSEVSAPLLAVSSCRDLNPLLTGHNFSCSFHQRSLTLVCPPVKVRCRCRV